MRVVAFLTYTCSLFLAQTVVQYVSDRLGISAFAPSFVLPLVAFVGARAHSLVVGVGVACSLGYVTDLYGISPVGLHAFVFGVLFLLARSTAVRVALQAIPLQVVLTFGLTLVYSASLLVLIAVLGRDTYAPRVLAPLVLPNAVGTAVVSPLVFWSAAKVRLFRSGARAVLAGRATS